MIDMLAGNGGGSHDLEMHGTNAGGNHDVQVVETQHGSPQEEQVFREAAVVEATTGVKGNKKRSKKFSVKEDNLLVAAWLEISMDAVQGIDQPRATYWERIHEHYHLHKDFETDRNCGSLAHRWGIILEAVNKFCSWYGHVQRRQESGLTEQDRVCIVVLLFQLILFFFANNKIYVPCMAIDTYIYVVQVLKTCEVFKNEEGKAFGLLHCWNVLGMRKSGRRHVQIRKRRPPPMLVQGHLLLQALKIIVVMNRTALVNPQKLPMQGLMVGRRRKNCCAKVKTPSPLLKTFTWMLWRICGLLLLHCWNVTIDILTTNHRATPPWSTCTLILRVSYV